MAEPIHDLDLTETRKIAANLIATTFCNGGTEAFLEAQADLLKGVETATTAWLHRRQEAIAETYRLLARMRDSRDVLDIWKAQQDWASGALQRLAADVSSYPSLIANAGQRAGEAARQGVNDAVTAATGTVAEAAQRSAEVLPKPLPARAGRGAAEAKPAGEMPTH
ncbi:MAG: hypothetical protein JO047_09865 [Alphaproteobacteria bacterium]|nr:hypothetical protein [Alphaproteobacteria bacterium]